MELRFKGYAMIRDAARRRLRRRGGRGGAQAGPRVLPPGARGEAHDAAGAAVPRRRRADARAGADLPELHHAGHDAERRRLRLLRRVVPIVFRGRLRALHREMIDRLGPDITTFPDP